MNFTGTVGKILDRNVQTRKGRATFYSVKLDEHEEWISLGTRRPTTFQEGDQVTITANQNAKGYWDAENVEVAPAKQRSAGSSTPASGVGSTSEGTVREGTRQVGNVAAGSGSADRQAAITHQHSQEMAIQTVAVLLEHDGLPLTKASTKAGEAKRFNEIVAAIDKFTVKYHKDVETQRLFATVADMGVVSTEADAPLPETADSEDDDGDTI